MNDNDTYELAGQGCPCCGLDYAALAEQLAACKRDAKRLEMLRWERDHAQACLEHATRHLSAIYAVMNPELTKLEDGRVFRFVNPLATECLDALSKRIREIPRELATINAALTNDAEAGR